MRIGEVSRRAGIPASTLRYYESEGLIAKPARVGGKRVYDPSILDVLTVIGMAKAAGFKVAEIHQLLRGFSRTTGPGKRWSTLATRKLGEIDAQLDQLRHMRRILEAVIACECPSFEDCAAAIRGRTGT
jgi:MerR family redox-sensitive transcriptional activator SoxR